MHVDGRLDRRKCRQAVGKTGQHGVIMRPMIIFTTNMQANKSSPSLSSRYSR